MECSICYEKFITVNSFEEFKILMGSVDKKDVSGFVKFQHMINKPFICCIDTCKSICCDGCISNIRTGGNIMDMTEEDIEELEDQTIHNYKCPFCRNIDWKGYMKTVVLNQLQSQILTDDEYYNQVFERLNFRFGMDLGTNLYLDYLKNTKT